MSQASTISQKVLYYPIPIVPGVAYGRVIHRHHFHLLTITLKIRTHSNRITIHYDVVAILPANIRKIIPKPLAPYDDVLRLVLFDDLEESLASLVILFGCASLARTTHRHLQIVEEDDRVPNLQPHRLICLLTYQRTLKLQESPHPVLPFLVLIEIIIKHLLSKAHTLPM